MDDSDAIKLLKAVSVEKELQITGLQSLLQQKEQEITELRSEIANIKKDVSDLKQKEIARVDSRLLEHAIEIENLKSKVQP